jgi:hypothetical protein
MKYRIGAWASVGFLVAVFWSFYLFPNTLSVNPIVVAVARATCPVTYLSLGIHFYWVLLANCGTYALIGLAIERLRSWRPSMSSTQL